MNDGRTDRRTDGQSRQTDKGSQLSRFIAPCRSLRMPSDKANNAMNTLSRHLLSGLRNFISILNRGWASCFANKSGKHTHIVMEHLE